MSPDEPLSKWARLEVDGMITSALSVMREDIRDEQDARHAENQKKLDRLIYLIIGTLLTTLGGIITELLVHSMSK